MSFPNRPSGYHEGMSDEIRIDWGSASVDGGRLTVPLAGKPSSEFKTQLQDIMERLHQGSGWGDVKVKKSGLRVDDVADGAEGDLRHFLESAVLQANANVAAEDEETPGDERSEEDQRRTDAFRAFSEDEDYSAGDRALELGLVHRRPALDPEVLRLGVELVARAALLAVRAGALTAALRGRHVLRRRARALRATRRPARAPCSRCAPRSPRRAPLTRPGPSGCP